MHLHGWNSQSRAGDHPRDGRMRRTRTVQRSNIEGPRDILDQMCVPLSRRCTLERASSYTELIARAVVWQKRYTSCHSKSFVQFMVVARESRALNFLIRTNRFLEGRLLRL